MQVKEKSPSVQGDSITSLPISIPLSTVHPSKLPVSIPLASVVLPSRAERLVSVFTGKLFQSRLYWSNVKFASGSDEKPSDFREVLRALCLTVVRAMVRTCFGCSFSCCSRHFPVRCVKLFFLSFLISFHPRILLRLRANERRPPLRRLQWCYFILPFERQHFHDGTSGQRRSRP